MPLILLMIFIDGFLFSSRLYNLGGIQNFATRWSTLYFPAGISNPERKQV